MKLNLSTRTQAVVLLLLVATSGALAGVVGDRLLIDRSSGERSTARPAQQAPTEDGPWRWEARPDERYGERLAHSLELTDAQRAAIDSIVDVQQDRVQALAQEIQPQFHAIAAEARSSIEEVLTPGQRARLHSLRDQRMRAMHPGMRELMRRDGATPARPGQPQMGPGQRGGPGMRPPVRDEVPPEIRAALREGRMWEYLDSIRGERPVWQVRDSLLREWGDTAAADRVRARRDSIATARGLRPRGGGNPR
jgi:Spy/CpxP family protein refolding chaperone